jgi:hypothetical protein
MLKIFVVLTASTFVMLPPVFAAEDPTEVDAVVAAVKLKNPEFKALCEQGSDAVRKATTDAVMALMGVKKISGNPRAVGAEAGAKLASDCKN